MVYCDSGGWTARSSPVPYQILPEVLDRTRRRPHPPVSCYPDRRPLERMCLRGCASHVRTDRPHPAPNGAGLARVALRPPVASLQTRALTAHGPVRGAFVLPATHDGGVASRHHPRRRPGNPSGAFLPLETLTKAHRPWNQTRGYRAPRPTRRRLSRPGTHEQAAFEPLHPDEGYSPPRPRAGHAVPAPQPGFVPVTTTERPLSRSQAAPPPQNRSHVKPGGIHGG